jgi:cell division protease FtsH
MYINGLIILSTLLLSQSFLHNKIVKNVKNVKNVNVKNHEPDENNNYEPDENKNYEPEDNEKPSLFEDFFGKGTKQKEIRIFLPLDLQKSQKIYNENDDNENDNVQKRKKNQKSKNFELMYQENFNFSKIGGYDKVKSELLQCADILVNYTKYEKYGVRCTKGVILEGPPGNGKTLLAKAFSGEINIGFIPVSGSQFQEMYIGVGASRVRELFDLAIKNKPCIIFIDEIDAIGRKRSQEGDSNSAERDTTLNELLVALDGFKDTNGVLLMGATNQIKLLDNALIRPGRIDKLIYIGNPDKKTREEIINIHLKGKPIDESITISNLVEMTNGFSGAEIENLLNEAMLYVLKHDRNKIEKQDIENVMNRILTGWQINENVLSKSMVNQIAIHEIGHALISIFTNYKHIIKVTINLNSPKSLGYTLFEDTEDNIIFTKNRLFKEIMVLLGGRVAEEIFYGNKISAGAIDDLNKVKNIIKRMTLDYAMGTETQSSSLFLNYNSEQYKQKLDLEIETIFSDAYTKTKQLLLECKPLVEECANLLTIHNEITEQQMRDKIKGIYDYLIE